MHSKANIGVNKSQIKRAIGILMINIEIRDQDTVTIIFSKECPANMLAKSLTVKLKILIMLENSSIKANTGAINKGTPSGKNWLKYLDKWIYAPKKLNPTSIEKE